METNPTSTAGLPRRDFLKTAATAAAAVASAPLLKNTVYGQSDAPSANVSGANNRIAVAVVGVGFGIGKDHLLGIHKNAGANNVKVAAACDLFSERRKWAKETAELNDSDVQVEYQKILERKDIDAVLIATHDPNHARITMDAIEAGKHVYCEKPLTRYLDEAFKVHDKVKSSGKVFQIGSQGCTAGGYHKCAELVKAGKLGKLVWAQVWYSRNSKAGEWNYEIDPKSNPENIDWKRWLGPIKDRPFSAEDFHRWRKYYRYCAGPLGDLAPHRLHPFMLATGNPEFPKRVCSIGTSPVHIDKEGNNPERETPEHAQLLAEFPSGLVVMVTCCTVNSMSPGLTLYGHKANVSIDSNGNRVELLPQVAFGDDIDPETTREAQPEDIRAHEKNWFDCIRNGQPPNANIDLAIRVQTVICLAEMADRLNMTCLFDEKTRKITDNNGKEVAPITYGALAQS
ncbi:MAG: oxidoreductase [Verrucomicrobia bacterium]|nr:MAG: oxidoreductase [Verrucomicrobiota bacterium]